MSEENEPEEKKSRLLRSLQSVWKWSVRWLGPWFRADPPFRAFPWIWKWSVRWLAPPGVAAFVGLGAYLLWGLGVDSPVPQTRVAAWSAALALVVLVGWLFARSAREEALRYAPDPKTVRQSEKTILRLRLRAVRLRMIGNLALALIVLVLGSSQWIFVRAGAFAVRDQQLSVNLATEAQEILRSRLVAARDSAIQLIPDFATRQSVRDVVAILTEPFEW